MSHDLTRAVALLRELEGLRLEPYLCPARRWTIGYGHMIRDTLGKPVNADAAHAAYGRGITLQDAERLLSADVAEVAAQVEALIRVPLTDAQFGALVSFVFNVGLTRFRESTLRKRINAGMLSLVPDELRRWVYCDGRPLEGLQRRREREIALWLGIH